MSNTQSELGLGNRCRG
ncbi:hypothetical protein ACLK19_00425 [Escherichia coli]